MSHKVNISKVIRLGKSLAMVIPKEICEDLNIKQGNFLGVQLKGDEIIIKKVTE